MLGFFKLRPPVDDEEYDWLVAGFAWLTREFGGNSGLRGAELVLPNQDFFPYSKLKGHDRALELFDQVRALAGMSDWQCDLIPGAASREHRVTTGRGLKHEGKGPPLGTFGYANGRYYVTYNPASLANPATLVATFAHELLLFLFFFVVLFLLGVWFWCVIHSFRSPGMVVKLTKLAKMVAAISSVKSIAVVRADSTSTT